MAPTRAMSRQPAPARRARSRPEAQPRRETAAAILAELERRGRDSYKRIILKHGAREPVWGVSVAELKTIQKRVKVDHQLALDLFDSGVFDAMYLAGLIADDARMTRKDLQRWVRSARGMIAEYTVPWVASGSPHGRELALEWIEDDEPAIACAGWATLGSLVGITDDGELDLAELKRLLARVQKTIHRAPNRVRYVMNGFLCSVACHVKPLSATALAAEKAIGPVQVDMGGTACKLPSAADYVAKLRQRGRLGMKRKSAKC
jgi:3-methyladenine DNA glycosylase AlkD